MNFIVNEMWVRNQVTLLTVYVEWSSNLLASSSVKPTFVFTYEIDGDSTKKRRKKDFFLIWIFEVYWIVSTFKLNIKTQRS